MVAVLELVARGEGEKLELKGRGALAHPETIVKAVVALLNTAGGHVIIGVGDDGTVEPITSPRRERERLTSLLIDTVEPRPVHRFDVVVENVDDARQVLCIVVRRAKGRPLYAQRQPAGALGFWVRVGASTRSLRLDEVQARMARRDGSPERPVRPDWRQGLSGKPGPILVLDAWFPEEWTNRPKLRNLADAIVAARDRIRLPGRRLGWTVLGSEGEPQPMLRRGQIEWGTGDPRDWRRWLRLDVNARSLRFEGYASWLAHPTGLPAERRSHLIHPAPLVESVVTFLRLLSVVRDEVQGGDAELITAIVNASRWQVASGSLAANTFWSPSYRWPAPFDDDPEPAFHLWGAGDDGARESPDEVARTLLAHLYEAADHHDLREVPYWHVDKFVLPP